MAYFLCLGKGYKNLSKINCKNMVVLWIVNWYEIHNCMVDIKLHIPCYHICQEELLWTKILKGHFD